ncbi:MAG: hypothetical protein Q9163_002176 [Psora crenata]
MSPGSTNLTIAHSPNWVTDTNRGPLVSVITWLLIVAVTLSWSVSYSATSENERDLQTDDDQVFAIGQTIATTLTPGAGLGKPISTLTDSQLCHLLIGRSAATLIVVWSFASIFVVAFQCPLPEAWATLGDRCIDYLSFWTFYHIFNILTDLILIVLPFIILGRLQMRARRKTFTLLCFSSRIFVIAATMVQLCQAQRKLLGTTDMTFDMWQVALCGEIVQALSIITACVPYLKPFVEALETGMIRAETGHRSDMDGFSSCGRNKKSPSLTNNSNSNPSNSVQKHPLKPLPRKTVYPYGAKVEGQSAMVSSEGRQTDADAESQSSQSRIIKMTVGWTVTDEQLPSKGQNNRE